MNDKWSSRAVRPPRAAEGLLRLLLNPVQAETISGDLLEEYRESVYPQKGKRSADLWFVRQVAGFAWRSAFVGSLVMTILVSGRFAFDTFAPPSYWGPRSAFSTWSAIALYLVVGFLAARRTRRATTGMLLAVTTHVIAHTVSFVVTMALFLVVIRYDPAMLTLFHQTGGWGEAWGLPLMMLPIVAALGSIGGLAGRYA
jgi:hypothetical protein